jgi:hypothetical protein
VNHRKRSLKVAVTLANFDIIRAVWVAEALNQVTLNRVYYQANPVAGTPTDFDALTALDNATGVPFPAVMGSAATYRGMQVQILRKRILPATGYALFAASVSTTFQGPGTNGTSLLPTQTRGIWRWIVGRAARGLNCRFYAPFPSSFASLAELPTGAYLASLTALRNAMSGPIVAGAGLNTATLFPVNFDTVKGVKDFFNGGASHQKWATQRKSGSYGRPNIAPF